MFTGIVQALLPIVFVDKKNDFVTIGISMVARLGGELRRGASVAVDGVCLTVSRMDEETAYFDIMVETLRKTTLDRIAKGRLVNVERSMRVGDEIGGHRVSGHITTTAIIVGIDQSEHNCSMTFQTTDVLIKYILPKGFVALDGASLTIVDVDKEKAKFTVFFIPETLNTTAFGHKKEGDFVNLEIDSQTQAIVDTVESVLRDRLDAMIGNAG